VLHLNTERGWRGGEQHVLWLAEALARRGHRALIAARPALPLAVRAAAAGIEVVPISPRSELAALAALQLRREIARRHVQIVHAHTAHTVALGALATLGSDVPLVVTRHVIFPLRRSAPTRWKYGRARLMIAVSAAVADALERSGVPRSRIEVVEGGVDMTHLPSPARDDVLQTLGVRGGPLVVMVGALTAEKDPTTFLHAIARARRTVPTLQALLVGEGWLRSRLEEERVSLGLAEIVQLTGWRDDADALLARADIVALSSRSEGMPVTLMHALALGKPIAATAVGGIPELITDGISGLLSPAGDSTGLGTSIARIACDRMLSEQLSAGARARGETLSMDQVAERTAMLYRRLLAN